MSVRNASRSLLVEVGPNTDGDGDAKAAECDPSPSGPPAPQGAVRGIDVLESVPPGPDGWDARQDAEDEAEHSEGESVPGASVDRVRGATGARVGVHTRVRSWRKSGETSIAGGATATRNAYEARSLVDNRLVATVLQFVLLGVGSGLYTATWVLGRAA
jgi:hypothetical protein